MSASAADQVITVVAPDKFSPPFGAVIETVGGWAEDTRVSSTWLPFSRTIFFAFGLEGKMRANIPAVPSDSFSGAKLCVESCCPAESSKRMA